MRLHGGTPLFPLRRFNCRSDFLNPPLLCGWYGRLHRCWSNRALLDHGLWRALINRCRSRDGRSALNLRRSRRWHSLLRLNDLRWWCSILCWRLTPLWLNTFHGSLATIFWHGYGRIAETGILRHKRRWALRLNLLTRRNRIRVLPHARLRNIRIGGE